MPGLQQQALGEHTSCSVNMSWTAGRLEAVWKELDVPFLGPHWRTNATQRHLFSSVFLSEAIVGLSWCLCMKLGR